MQADCGEQNGDEVAKGMRSKWSLIAIAGKHGKDRAVSGVSRSHLQKWQDLSSAKRLLILFVLLVYVCRRIAATVDGGCQWCIDNTVSRVCNARGIT